MRQWLRNAREAKGFSQQSVAEKIGITRQYYQQIETGERQQKMDITLVTKLSQIFDMPINQIVDNESNIEKGENV